MSYGAGPSYQVSDDSSSSSSEDESYHEDSELEFDIQAQNTVFQWNHLMLQQQTMMQQYYLMQSRNSSVWGGSVPGHRVVNRGRQVGATLLRNDYFSENSIHENKFRERFRMSRELFLRIRIALKDHSSLWKKSYDAARQPGFSSYQKMCASIQFLAYGTADDSFDQYFQIGESTLLDYVKHFCRDIVMVFGPTYLRKPNADDIEKLLQVAEARGFPGMLGSLDCMHWEWKKNCPTANAEAYRARNKGCTMILEAVASYDTWIWHALFHIPSTNNDVNVFHKSNLFQNLTDGTSLPANYFIKGRNYKVGYYLADGIYPKWSTLVQTIHGPKSRKERYFVKEHESYRKDVERAFGVLQAQFAIVRGVARLWNKDTLHDVMSACIIMHNMIVETERSGYNNSYTFDNYPPPLNITYESSPSMPPVDVMRDTRNLEFVNFFGRHGDLMNQGEHNELKRRLVAHLWDHHGEEANEE